jgi:hypothetical protein
VRAKETYTLQEIAPQRPLLMVDIDGVISLFGVSRSPVAAGAAVPEGRFCSIDGVPHFLSFAAAEHVLALAEQFDLVWASGWEERADEHLPHLLGMPAGLPYLRFARGSERAGSAHSHWKLEAIEAYAGSRPLAWVDDDLPAACHEWAAARTAPTLLVATAPEHGLTASEAKRLGDWAAALSRG